MNEKIKQFAINSQLVSVNDLNGDLVSSYQEDVDLSEELEAFANMIIKECAAIVWHQPENIHPCVIAEVMKKNFGIQE